MAGFESGSFGFEVTALLCHNHCQIVSLFFFKKNGPTPASFFCLFSVFSNKHYNFYNKYMWKNIHPVYGAGIWTHDLWNVSSSHNH